MAKRILIIKACGVTGEDEECNNIKVQAEMYGMETDLICPTNIPELVEGLNSGNEYDYIYLSSHGSDTGLCNHNGSIDLSWTDFGLMLCESMCMKKNCILMLSCCRGGLNQVAYDLFYCCSDISYVVGPRQSLPAADMLISFNLMLYNLTYRGLDPIVACEKIKAATDLRFMCFDRLEVEAEMGYILRCNSYDTDFTNQVIKIKEKAHEAPPEVMQLGNIIKNN